MDPGDTHPPRVLTTVIPWPCRWADPVTELTHRRVSSPGQSQSSPEYRQKKTQNAVSVEISTETCGQETIKIQAKKDIVKAGGKC